MFITPYMEHKQKLSDYYTQSYSSIRYKSKRAGRGYPNITKDAFIHWLIINRVEYLWEQYVESGYESKMKPSVDRIDPHKGYEFGNMQLITWGENHKKGVNSQKHHDNCNPHKREVILKHKHTGEVLMFESRRQAAGVLGVHEGSITRVMTGKRKTIKGYFTLTGEELEIK